jgi:uncharacterized protein (TIGR00661 family)
MRIVYGVSGEGFGHVCEALEVAPALQRDGHEVKILTYGDRACAALAPFQPTRIEGVPLHFGPRGLSLRRTAAANAHVLPFYLRNWGRLDRELRAFEPDAFLIGFEPFTALAAQRLRRPLVSMDNQRALLYLREAPPGHRLSFTLATAATRGVTRGAAAYLVKTLDAARPADPRVHFVAPLVQAELRRLAPTEGGHILVYLTKPNPALLALLRALPHEFRVYDGQAPGRDGNLRHCAPGPGFLSDLAGCRAIVGTSGFSLVADAIHLRKPYFAVPLRGQFEQTLNALHVARHGLGAWSEQPTRALLEDFLGQLPRYRENLARISFDPDEQIRTLRAVLRRVVASWPQAAGRRAA